MGNMQSPEKVIEGALPEQINTIKKIDVGWTHLVFEVNDRWMFRFVRDVANTQLSVEQDFLPVLAKESPLLVPNIRYFGPDYIGYEKIVGDGFSEALYATLDDKTKDLAAEDLGRFLSGLHGLQFEHKNLKHAPFGGEDFWQDLWPVVAPYLGKDVKQRVEKYFQEVLPIVQAASFDEVITHSDFGTNNVLFNQDQNRVAGVIDFGDLSLGDPAVDFATFYRRFGKTFAKRMVACYTLPVGEEFWVRVDYEAKRKLVFVVYFALEQGFDLSIPMLVQEIDKLFWEGNTE